MSEFQWSTQDYVYVTAECVTGVLSVLGNSLVLLAIARTRALHTITNCFIGSLAAADILVGLILPPTVILPYRGLPHNFHGCVLMNTVVVLITNISILNLLAVALERYLAISDPFRYQRVMTVRRAMGVVTFTWIIAIFIGLIPTMGWNLGQEGFTSCSFTKVIDMKYMVYLIFFAVNLPPLFFMLVIYIYIFRIIRKQQRAVAQLTVLSRDQKQNARQQKREVRGAKGLAYVIVLFALCWMPIHILNSITLFAPEKSAPLPWLLVAIVLSHANSFINPFLYAFSNSKFKRAMLSTLFCGRCQACYVADTFSEGDSRPAPTLPPLNGSLGSKMSKAPSMSSVDASQHPSRKHSRHSSGVSFNIHNGVVNNAFTADETFSTDDEEVVVSNATDIHRNVNPHSEYDRTCNNRGSNGFSGNQVITTIRPKSAHSESDCVQTKSFTFESNSMRPKSAHSQSDCVRPKSAHSQSDCDRPKSAHSQSDSIRPKSAHSQSDHVRPKSTHSQRDCVRPKSAHSQSDCDRPKSFHSASDRESLHLSSHKPNIWMTQSSMYPQSSISEFHKPSSLEALNHKNTQHSAEQNNPGRYSATVRSDPVHINNDAKSTHQINDVKTMTVDNDESTIGQNNGVSTVDADTDAVNIDNDAKIVHQTDDVEIMSIDYDVNTQNEDTQIVNTNNDSNSRQNNETASRDKDVHRLCQTGDTETITKNNDINSETKDAVENVSTDNNINSTHQTDDMAVERTGGKLSFQHEENVSIRL